MASQTGPNTQFDNLFIEHFEGIEKKLRSLLSQTVVLEDKSLYISILLQIVSVRAAQNKPDVRYRISDLTEKKEGQPRFARLGVFYSNLLKHYINAKQYPNTLFVFKEYTQGRAARWESARSLRLGGDLDGALEMQLCNLKEYSEVFKDDVFSGEQIIIDLSMIYEELAMIYLGLHEELCCICVSEFII